MSEIASAGDRAVDKRRKAHRKVKTGCTACKTRRQKCGEQKPRCTNCVRHSTECIYLQSTKASLEGRREMPSYPLSLTSNPPTVPSRDFNLEDLELMHQYVTSTSVATSQRPEATSTMQTIVPRLAQEHPFLMRGLLAQAAIQLSWVRPSQKARYDMLAAKHHNYALPEFQASMHCMNEDNHLALILYSKGLVWCSFAWYETATSVSQTDLGETASNWLPTWFHLLRGSCLIVESCRTWLKTGWHFLPPPIDDLTHFDLSSDSQRLSTLASQLVPLVESHICQAELTALREAFARASMKHHNTPLRNAMNFWVGHVSNEFLQLVQNNEPWALVLMAHFCILVSRSETVWFMKGHGARLLQSIVERLAHPWTQYLQWPLEEVGL